MLGWVIPLVGLSTAGALAALHDRVPEGPDLSRCREVAAPDADGEAQAVEPPLAPDEVFLGDTLVCHRADLDRRTPGDAIAFASAWSGVWVAVTVLLGLACAGVALAGSWRFRKDDPRARRIARIALTALLALIGVPVLLGAAVLALVAVSPIRG